MAAAAGARLPGADRLGPGDKNARPMKRRSVEAYGNQQLDGQQFALGSFSGGSGHGAFSPHQGPGASANDLSSSLMPRMTDNSLHVGHNQKAEEVVADQNGQLIDDVFDTFCGSQEKLGAGVSPTNPLEAVFAAAGPNGYSLTSSAPRSAPPKLEDAGIDRVDGPPEGSPRGGTESQGRPQSHTAGNPKPKRRKPAGKAKQPKKPPRQTKAKSQDLGSNVSPMTPVIEDLRSAPPTLGIPSNLGLSLPVSTGAIGSSRRRQVKSAQAGQAVPAATAVGDAQANRAWSRAGVKGNHSTAMFVPGSSSNPHMTDGMNSATGTGFEVGQAVNSSTLTPFPVDALRKVEFTAGERERVISGADQGQLVGSSGRRISGGSTGKDLPFEGIHYASGTGDLMSDADNRGGWISMEDGGIVGRSEPAGGFRHGHGYDSFPSMSGAGTGDNDEDMSGGVVDMDEFFRGPF